MSIPLARVVRSGLEESVHLGDVGVVDVEGRLVAHAGDPERLLFARSCMKPLQAVVSLSFAGIEFPDPEVAVMCASHNAEPIHVATVRSLLARADVPEDALRCPSVRPWDEATAERSPEPRRINSDCSGKHGGMLAACRAQGWPTESYRERDHPLQVAVLETVRAVSGEASPRVGIDGCGVPVHGLPLASMATIYARLAAPGSWGTREGEAMRAASAMRSQPYLVAGRNRPDTAVMETVDGVVLKGGAEGLMCAAILPAGLGVSVRIRDGSARAAGPAMIHVLRLLDAVDDAALAALGPFARPPVLGGGEPVGEIVAEFDLERD